jgi:hypothetical protein
MHSSIHRRIWLFHDTVFGIFSFPAGLLFYSRTFLFRIYNFFSLSITVEFLLIEMRI